jgi:hypothetical protein
MSFTIVSKPALNKDGYAKVTFKGHVKEDALVDSITGEQTRRAFVKLAFEIMDTTRKSPIKVNVIGGALTGKFLTAIEALGYSLKSPTLTEDSDGFQVETTETSDEEGFELETVDAQALIDELELHLEAARGSVLLAKVVKSKRGYWEIDVDTLKPLTK